MPMSALGFLGSLDGRMVGCEKGIDGFVNGFWDKPWEAKHPLRREPQSGGM